MVGLTKQAALLSEKQVKNAISRMSDYKNSLRNRAIIELTLYAGLRAKEVASLRWSHILNEEGEVGEVIKLTNDASKGKSGGLVPINSKLKATLLELRNENKGKTANDAVISNGQGQALKRQSVVNLLWEHYRKCDIQGASSHSGRKYFITNAARKISLVGGSINDIREIARHKNLQTTQLYISHNNEAQRKVVEMIV